MDYAMWRSCERFKMSPTCWEDLTVWDKAKYIAYNQIRCYEEAKLEALLEAIIKAKR